MKENNVLVIADPHEPFAHKHYLDFCYETKKKYNCSLIYLIGDAVDYCSTSRHERFVDGLSPKQEYDEALSHLKKWYKAFPNVNACMGNHDERLERACDRFGISTRFMKNFRELYEFPNGWDYKFDYYIYGIRVFHGMGYSGEHAHTKAVKQNQCSIVMGHLHSNAGVYWTANEKTRCFGLAVGCGIDRNSYAFNYGRDYVRKPILGCGVILNNGKHPMFVPMEL